MVILAIYYTLADLALLGQLWWYRGFILRDHQDSISGGDTAVNDERGGGSEYQCLPIDDRQVTKNLARKRSVSTTRKHFVVCNETHPSPTTPLLLQAKPENSPKAGAIKSRSGVRSFLYNSSAVVFVCAAGIFGWWLSASSSSSRQYRETKNDKRGRWPEFDAWGQTFGWLCAVLYLGSRVPQLLLNYRRKSTEGVSLLFFVFACIGNLTYSVSIFAFDPTPYCHHGRAHCVAGEKEAVYARYIAVNASWIAGSLGTLLLDLCIFAQFFLYRTDDEAKCLGRVADGYGVFDI